MLLLAAEATKEASKMADIEPFLGIVSLIICWFCFIIVLAMLKGFISRGFSMALAEFLLKNCSEEKAERLVRWFGNGEDVLEELKLIKETVNKPKET
jgi:hypothetical protein